MDLEDVVARITKAQEPNSVVRNTKRRREGSWPVGTSLGCRREKGCFANKGGRGIPTQAKEAGVVWPET